MKASLVSALGREYTAELAMASDSFDSAVFVTSSEAPIRVDPESYGVVVSEEDMEFHRPYPFQVGGVWLVAVRHRDDRRVAFYQLA